MKPKTVLAPENTSIVEKQGSPLQLLGVLEEMMRLLCQLYTQKETGNRNLLTYMKIGLLLITITVRYLRKHPQK